MLRRNDKRTAVLIAGLLAAVCASARAQDLTYVTSVSTEGAALLETADGEQWPLGTAAEALDTIEAGQVRVTSGQQLMLVTEWDVVLVVLGPAALRFDPQEERTNIELLDGRVLCASQWPEEGATPLVLVVPGSAPDTPTVEAVVPPGQLAIERTAEQTALAYRAAPDLPPSMALRVLGTPRSLADGDMLRIVGDEVSTAPAAAWLREREFDRSWGAKLGVASAQTVRPGVESDLFENIISWERYGGKEYVKARLEAQRFQPEVRQVVTSVSRPQRPVSPPSSVPQTTGFPAANEVPLLSPAALSVANLSEGVTAIQLNNQARSLLTQTGSRGLGFRGLAQLAIPGLLGGGIPTPGPAGLGGQR